MLNIEKIKKTEHIICDTSNFTPTRIDKFLLDSFPDYSRAYFQTLIKHGLILVNDTINKKSSYIVKPQDAIQVNFPEEKQFDLTPQKVDFDIIDTQDNFIIINKPAGLIVHPSQKRDKRSNVGKWLVV